MAKVFSSKRTGINFKYSFHTFFAKLHKLKKAMYTCTQDRSVLQMSYFVPAITERNKFH